MLVDWNGLSEGVQLVLAQEALRRASEIIAGHAELLAEEMDDGAVPDQGGPNALRLLAGIMRMNGSENFGMVESGSC